MDYKEEIEIDVLDFQAFWEENPLCCCHCDDVIFQEYIYHECEFTCLECLEAMSTREMLNFLSIDISTTE